MKAGRIKKRRNEILFAAMEMFAQKGYHATKISDIAESLEIGNGTCYRYFKNKLDIFLSVLQKIVNDIGEVVASELPDQTNTLEEYRLQLTRIGEKLFGVLNEHRRGQIVFYEIFGVDPELNKNIDVAMDVFNKYTELYLINGMKKGFLKPDLDTATLSKAINEMLFGAMKDLLASPDPKRDLPKWMNAIMLLMLEGMGFQNRQA